MKLGTLDHRFQWRTERAYAAADIRKTAVA